MQAEGVLWNRGLGPGIGQGNCTDQGLEKEMDITRGGMEPWGLEGGSGKWQEAEESVTEGTRKVFKGNFFSTHPGRYLFSC
jgi:hypothetical protein